MDILVRKMGLGEIDLVVNYFLGADHEFLELLGVDPDKLLNGRDWNDLIANDMRRPRRDKQLYYLIWELDGTAIGHSHINDIQYGKQAFMHLHLWDSSERQRGLGTRFVRASVPLYFETFKLDRLYCQPHARNEAPNRTLARAGFEFVETIEMTPSWVNFHQPINRWLLRRSDLEPATGPRS